MFFCLPGQHDGDLADGNLKGVFLNDLDTTQAKVNLFGVFMIYKD